MEVAYAIGLSTFFSLCAVLSSRSINKNSTQDGSLTLTKNKTKKLTQKHGIFLPFVYWRASETSQVRSIENRDIYSMYVVFAL